MMAGAAASPLLQVRDLDMAFDGLRALSDLSFDVPRGTIKGIIGPNGAGKTTLFNIVAGVISPTAGTIRLDSQNIERLPSFRRVGLGIARTFQNLQIFRDMTVLENVMIGCHPRSRSEFLSAIFRTPASQREEARIREAAMEKLSLLGLAHRAQEQAGALSFGEGKILEIARALAAEPALLLLDEPIAGVPHGEVEGIASVIRQINRSGVTVLLVEHNMRLVMDICDEILVLNYGRRIAEGPPDAIRRDPEVLRAYLGEDDDA